MVIDDVELLVQVAIGEAIHHLFQGENPAVYGGREADNSPHVPPSVAV